MRLIAAGSMYQHLLLILCLFLFEKEHGFSTSHLDVLNKNPNLATP